MTAVTDLLIHLQCVALNTSRLLYDFGVFDAATGSTTVLHLCINPTVEYWASVGHFGAYHV